MIPPLADLREVMFERDDARRFVVGHWESRTFTGEGRRVFVPLLGGVVPSGSEVVCDDPVLDDVRIPA